MHIIEYRLKEGYDRRYDLHYPIMCFIHTQQ